MCMINECVFGRLPVTRDGATFHVLAMLILSLSTYISIHHVISHTLIYIFHVCDRGLIFIGIQSLHNIYKMELRSNFIETIVSNILSHAKEYDNKLQVPTRPHNDCSSSKTKRHSHLTRPKQVSRNDTGKKWSIVHRLKVLGKERTRISCREFQKRYCPTLYKYHETRHLARKQTNNTNNSVQDRPWVWGKVSHSWEVEKVCGYWWLVAWGVRPAWHSGMRYSDWTGRGVLVARLRPPHALPPAWWQSLISLTKRQRKPTASGGHVIKWLTDPAGRPFYGNVYTSRPCYRRPQHRPDYLTEGDHSKIAHI